MADQIYYEDVEVGTKLPPLVKHPTSRQLVMWAAASGDLTEIHYDKDFAINQGFPDVIVQGDLTGAFLVQLITDWMGEGGTFKKLSTRNNAIILVNEDVICNGIVRKKYIEKDEHYVEWEVWAENGKGEKCTIGKAYVTLPARSNNDSV